jgi:hypothetical protein
MKSNIMKVIVMSAFIAVFSVGCALTQQLPSLTLGGAANKKAVLDVSLNKRGLSVTAPLINVDVPLPSVKKTKE